MNRSSARGSPRVRRRALTLHGTARRVKMAQSNCLMGSRGAGSRPATACWTTCAACGRSRFWAGSSRTAFRSARAATGSCSASNRDHSGIDLVCHPRRPPAAGREPVAGPHPERQLAGPAGGRQVDPLRRDLRCDEGHRERQLVFQPPADEPAPAAVALDRRTTYNAGPVAATSAHWPSATSTRRCGATGWTASSAARSAACKSSAAASAAAVPCRWRRLKNANEVATVDSVDL